MDPQAVVRPNRPTLAVATIGHHRHGKTTLTAAITQLLARRAPDEVRGWTVEELDRRSHGTWPMLDHGHLSGAWRPRHVITVEGAGPQQPLTVAPTTLFYTTSQRRFVHVDSPGRRPWLKNAARAQGAVDAVILVVSGNEGVQPQTREHLLLARALGLRQLVVFISKCDMVRDAGWLDLVEHDVRELLGQIGFDGDAIRIVRGAALPVCEGPSAWDGGVADLIEALELELEIPVRAVEGEPLLFIHRVNRWRADVGVVVEGRLRRGAIGRGDSLTLVGFGEDSPVLVRDLEDEHRKIDRASAGQMIGVLVGGVTRFPRLRSGQALVGADARAVGSISARVELLARELGGRRTPMRDGHRVSLLFGATVVGATLRLDGALEPGGSAELTAELLAPVLVEPGSLFLLRDGNQGPLAPPGAPIHWAGTSGMGQVLTVTPVTS